jgi:hypothetical protein
MATNFYFQAGTNIGTTNEQRLVEDLIIEAIQIKGHDIYYMPRTSVNPDHILGEDPMNQFTQVYPIEMYMNNVQGWEGDGELMSKFGIQVTDNATFVVSKRRWEDAVASQTDDLQLPLRPAEGDLLYFPKTKAFFEIKYVNHLDPFFQIGKFYVYSLQCELYRYSSENIDTGVEEVDNRAAEKTQDTFAFQFLNQTGGAFLSQSGTPIILASSSQVEDSFDDTTPFETKAQDIVDFSVIDPFGEF